MIPGIVAGGMGQSGGGGGTLAFIAPSSTVSIGSATSHTVPIPTVSDGVSLLLHLSLQRTVGAGFTVTPPSGWAVVVDTAAPLGASSRDVVLHRIAGAAEPNSVAVVTGQQTWCSAICWAVSGASSSAPEYEVNIASSSNAAPPSLTLSTSSQCAWIVSVQMNDLNNDPSSYPLPDYQTVARSELGRRPSVIGCATLADGPTLAPGRFTTNSAFYRAYTFGFEPA